MGKIDLEYERFLDKGNEFYSQQEYLKSYLCFEKIFNSPERDIDSAINCATCLINVGNDNSNFFKDNDFLEKINEKIDYVLEKDSKNYDILVIKAELIKNCGNLLESLELLSEIEKNQDVDLDLKFNKGCLFLDLKRYDEAVEIFEKLIENKFSSYKVLPKLVFALYKTNRIDRIQDLITVSKDLFNSNMPEITFIFAQMHYGDEQWINCLSLCKWLIETHGGISEYWDLLHKTLNQLGKNEFSNLAYQTSLLLDRKNIDNKGNPEFKENTNNFFEFLDKYKIDKQDYLSEMSLYFNDSSENSFDFQIKKHEKWLEESIQADEQEAKLASLTEQAEEYERNEITEQDIAERVEDEKFAQEYYKEHADD